MEADRLGKYLQHIVVQNAHNAARLNALLKAAANILAKQEGTDYDTEIRLLMEEVNRGIPDHLAAAIDAINDLPNPLNDLLK